MGLLVDPTQEQNHLLLLWYLLVDVDDSLVLAGGAPNHARQLGVHESLDKRIQSLLVKLITDTMVDEELCARGFQGDAWVASGLLRSLDDAGGERRGVDVGPGLEAGAVVEVVDGGLAGPAGNPVVLFGMLNLLAKIEGDEAGR